MKDRTAIISGRYVLIHPGHIRTIRREAKRFKLLYVYIVYGNNTLVNPQWAKEIIGFATKDLGNVVPILDDCHFGYATEDDIDRLPPHDVFVSGNKDVSEHLRGLGVNVEDIEQTAGYSTTDVKEALLQEVVRAWRRDSGK